LKMDAVQTEAAPIEIDVDEVAAKLEGFFSEPSFTSAMSDFMQTHCDKFDGATPETEQTLE
jgi:hypothetical protein